MKPSLRQLPDAEAVARAAADEVVGAAARAVAARGWFSLALAGGATPRRLYALLADPRAPFRARVPWGLTHVFFGDERPVPPGHPESNYRMAKEALLDHVPVASVHRIHGEEAGAGEAYERELRSFFGVPAGGAPPRLDLVLLGLGADGHTASLFPGSAALGETSRWVVDTLVDRLGTRRTTLTLPVLNSALAIVFLVSGAEKAPALRRVLGPADGEDRSPAARVRPERGSVLWLADRAAAGGLVEGGARGPREE